jgi:hypothetical protein
LFDLITADVSDVRYLCFQKNYQTRNQKSRLDPIVTGIHIMRTINVHLQSIVVFHRGQQTCRNDCFQGFSIQFLVDCVKKYHAVILNAPVASTVHAHHLTQTLRLLQFLFSLGILKVETKQNDLLFETSTHIKIDWERNETRIYQGCLCLLGDAISA